MGNSNIIDLFEQWNDALQTRNPQIVTNLYAPDAILLPTLSGKIRSTPDEITDYFNVFLQLQPRARIQSNHTRDMGNVLINSGIYVFNLVKEGMPVEVPVRFTFVYENRDEQWLIIEHHSSLPLND